MVQLCGVELWPWPMSQNLLCGHTSKVHTAALQRLDDNSFVSASSASWIRFSALATPATLPLLLIHTFPSLHLLRCSRFSIGLRHSFNMPTIGNLLMSLC